MKQELLEIRNGSIKEGSEYILCDINFYICLGETVSICGFHGAGKSTLAKVMSGKRVLTEGDIYWEEKTLDHMMQDKVCCLYELIEAVYGFGVYDYMFAMRPAGWKKILYNKKTAIVQTGHLLKEAEIDINPLALMDELSRWQKFMLQILKYAVYGAKIIILDEVAMEFGIEMLWPFLERMKKKYALSIIYISSTVDLAAEISDRTYIMRERTLVYMSHNKEGGQLSLEKAMFQYEASNIYQFRDHTDSPVIFETKIIALNGEEIPLAIKKGEVAGILDLDGKMREGIVNELEKACSDKQSVHNNVCIIHEREQKGGFFADLSLKENVLISCYRRYQKYGMVDQNLMDYLWEKEIRPSLNVTDESGLTHLDKLKMILFRKLILNPHLLILDNFTLYLDPLEREEILKFIGELARQGIGFLLISSNLPEAYSICDRILILQEQGKWKYFERQPEE